MLLNKKGIYLVRVRETPTGSNKVARGIAPCKNNIRGKP